MDEEKGMIIEEVMLLLDQMLEDHEKFKDEYGKKYEKKTPEERKKLHEEEIKMTYNFLEKRNMKIETINTDE